MIKKTGLRLLFLLPLLFSCNMEIPEKISVKTNAAYSFTIGDFSKNLSEYLSVESIREKMDSSGSGFNNFEVYDYNPEGKSDIQQYLVEIPFQEIPVDVSSYMDKIKFSDDGNAISVKQEINVPNFGDIHEQAVIDFPDISSKFAGRVVPLADITIPEANVSTSDNLHLVVNIGDPAFTAATFYSGKINLKLNYKSGTNTPGYSTNLTFKLESDGKEIDKVENVDISGGNVVVPFDVTDKTIKSSLVVLVYGSSEGGVLLGSNVFESKADFSDDVKLKSITGFTQKYSADDINQTVNIVTDSTFVKCKIEEGSFEIYSVAPSGWKGVTAKISNCTFSGALSSSSEFKDIKKTTDFFRRKMDLAGAVYSKGNISFTAKMEFELDNATLYFEKDEAMKLKVDTVCKIEKVESIEIDLTEKADMLSFNKSTALPEDVKKYVKEMVLFNSGLEITYTNSFPKVGEDDENSISIVAKSTTLNIVETKRSLLPESFGKTVTILSPDSVPVPVKPDTDEIDFDIKLVLPTATGLPPNHAVLKGVKLNEKYEIAINAKPVFDWKTVTLRTDSMAQSGEFDTGLSFNSLFGGLKESLGDDSAFVDNMKFVSLPIFINCSKPDLAGLSDVKFSGTVTMKGGTDYSEICELIKADNEIKFTELEKLEMDKYGSVITKLNGNDSNKADLANLLNSDKTVPLKLDYNLTLGGLDGELTISKQEFEDLKKAGDAPTAISVTGRLVLPLEIMLDAPDEQENQTTIDILSLSGHKAGEDLFNRSEGNSLDDIEKYINLIQYSNILYDIDNGLFRYDIPGKYGKVVFVNSDPEAKVSEYDLSMEGGTCKVYTEDIKGMLKNYPFDPSVKAILPDGILKIPRNAEFRVNLSLVIKTLGQVTLFGEED